MPSHTWNELDGMMRLDPTRLLGILTRKPPMARVLLFIQHIISLCSTTQRVWGDRASAIQAAKDLAKLNGNTAMLSLALIRFGRFDEVLQIDAELMVRST